MCMKHNIHCTLSILCLDKGPLRMPSHDLWSISLNLRERVACRAVDLGQVIACSFSNNEALPCGQRRIKQLCNIGVLPSGWPQADLLICFKDMQRQGVWLCVNHHRYEAKLMTRAGYSPCDLSPISNQNLCLACAMACWCEQMSNEPFICGQH